MKAYETKRQTQVEKLKMRTLLVKEVKTFTGKTQNKAKLFENANVISPDGQVMYSTIYNLNDFSHQVGLFDSWKLQEVILGIRPSYKGWTRAIY